MRVWQTASCSMLNSCSCILSGMTNKKCIIWYLDWTYVEKHVIITTFTHRGRDIMAAIFQTPFSNAFSGMKIYEFWLKFHGSFFLGLNYQYSRVGSYTGLVPIRRLWVFYWRICVTRPQWVKSVFQSVRLSSCLLQPLCFNFHHWLR